MALISTHILDISLGRPAAQVGVILESLHNENEPILLAEVFTNDDGRVMSFPLKDSALVHGNYRLTFDIKSYFDRTGRSSIFPQVTVNFTTDKSRENYHLPLLISPFGYSTYRGS